MNGKNKHEFLTSKSKEKLKSKEKFKTNNKINFLQLKEEDLKDYENR
jgi:hypothetical protein